MISDLSNLSASLILKNLGKDNKTNVIIRKTTNEQLAPTYLYTKSKRV